MRTGNQIRAADCVSIHVFIQKSKKNYSELTQTDKIFCIVKYLSDHKITN